MSETIPEAVQQSLKSSGFPFQTAVAHVIRNSKGWSIHASEYPWRAGNDDRFLDVVATNGKFFITVECKKTRQETFTFLRPLGDSNTGHVEDFRGLRADRYDVIPPQAHLFCETWGLWPKSPCSEFCIISTSKSGKDQRLLERDASLVVGATDAFAQDIQEHLGLGHTLSPPYLFLPVIVTNAKIFTARYKPSEVSLDTGEFYELPKEIEEASWVRFSKTFAAGRRRDLGLRSLFVVNATALENFLQNLEIAPNQSGDKVSVPFDLNLVPKIKLP